jgi:ATP-binding cassette subfamily B protein
MQRQGMDAARLTSFLTTLVLLIEPIQATTDAYNEVKQKEAGAARVLLPLDTMPTIVEHRNAQELPRTGSLPVTFEDVHYGYPSGETVLRGVSFVAEAGQLTAVVGASGSGKSTLAKLLLRLYEPQQVANREYSH